MSDKTKSDKDTITKGCQLQFEEIYNILKRPNLLIIGIEVEKNLVPKAQKPFFKKNHNK